MSQLNEYETRNWYKITFTPGEVSQNEPEKVEGTHSQTIDINPFPIEVSLYEQVPLPEDGSRIYFLTPNAGKYFKSLIESYHWELSKAPKYSEVRAAGAFINPSWPLAE